MGDVVRIRQINPVGDASGLDRCYQVVAECDRLDDPALPARSSVSFATWVCGFGDPRQVWLTIDAAGQPACYVLTLPVRENPAMAMCLLAVAPARRRAGTGTALLAHCASRARLAGRTRLAGEALDGSPGASFAAAAGARAGLARVVRELVIEPGLGARLAELRAAAARRAAGYTLLSWAGVTADEYLADSARLSATMADAPTDEGVEPQVWDAGRSGRSRRPCWAAAITSTPSPPGTTRPAAWPRSPRSASTPPARTGSTRASPRCCRSTGAAGSACWSRSR